MGSAGGISSILAFAFSLAVIVGLPALLLVCCGMWHRWVRAHFWESFAVACALVIALEAFTLMAVCGGIKW